MRKFLFALIPVILATFLGCSSGFENESDPRKVVIKMFRAMEENERETIAHYLDFESLIKPGLEDYALKMDSVRKFKDFNALLDDLVEGGLTYERWSPLQKVVGAATESTDSALVEVSFINKNSETQYYNKFGLRKINDRWKIYSFSVK
jgi:hypothetical protein